MSNRRIPLSFVEARRNLTWREMDIGIQEGWLAPESAVSLAVERIEQGDEDPNMFRLASVFKDQREEIRDALADLVLHSPGNSKTEARLTWMRILLAWLYENRSQYVDPLGVIEEIYADFGYPDEIHHLVRYNPTDQPGALSEDGFMRLWSEYLEKNLPPRIL